MNSVLVLCEGNICRSPMAQGLLAAAMPGVSVASAGTHALVGMPADETAVRLMANRKLDIGGHRGQQLTRMLVHGSDLIFVMEMRQLEYVTNLYPEARGKTFRLCERAKLDVEDPFRRPEAVFRKALMCIEDGVSDWVNRIQRL